VAWFQNVVASKTGKVMLLQISLGFFAHTVLYIMITRPTTTIYKLLTADVNIN